MGKSSRKKPARPASKRRSGALGFGIVIAAIVVVGIGGIIASRGDDPPQEGVAVGDHWHAAFGVNICGEWQPNTAQYESGTGIHSHGDGFIHLHPYSRAGTGDNATVGLYLEGAGEHVDSDSIRLAGGLERENGDPCENLDGAPGQVRWTLNGEEQQTNPANYRPDDGDVIALAFLPEDEEIGVPPVVRGGQQPTDIPGGQAPATPGGAPGPAGTPAPESDPTATSSSAPGATDTTAG